MRWIAAGLAAVVLAVGLVGWWRYIDLTSADGSSNLALADEKATAEVQSSVAPALERVLSYDYSKAEATKAAAKSLLAGDASKEYDELFASLQQKAPDQKLVLTAKVAAIGVVELNDDKADLLVFIDQSSRRAKDKDASVSAAQLSVKAERKSGKWIITGLKPL